MFAWPLQPWKMQLTNICARIYNRIKAFCLSGSTAQLNYSIMRLHSSPTKSDTVRNTLKRYCMLPSKTVLIKVYMSPTTAVTIPITVMRKKGTST